MGIRLSEQSEFECRRCGATDKNILYPLFPIVLAEFGKIGKLQCQICGHMWLQEKEKYAGTR